MDELVNDVDELFVAKLSMQERRFVREGLHQLQN